MARRNVLNGASPWEREEKANQQRDYAAQLQEQVRQKQAKQEQEKARKQQEQREELEMLERARVAAIRKHQPQEEQPAVPVMPPIPAPSPPRAVSMLTVESQQQGGSMTSPLKSVSTGPGFSTVADAEQHHATAVPTAKFSSESYTPAFSTAPSIFESLLREPGIGARSIAFYDDLAALQRLADELDSTAKLRRQKTQNNYVKPNFLHQQETSSAAPTTISTTTSRSPVKFSEDKVNSEDNQLDHQHTSPRSNMHDAPRFTSQGDTERSDLDAESVLLPLDTTAPRPSLSHSKPIPRAGASPVKQPYRSPVAVETEEDAMEDLDNDSEMLPF